MKKKYYELYKQIKTEIISGEYKAGDKLPSKRVMADKYGYSLITVENAYGMLAEEGYIATKERSGYFMEWFRNTVPHNCWTKKSMPVPLILKVQYG